MMSGLVAHTAQIEAVGHSVAESVVATSKEYGFPGEVNSKSGQSGAYSQKLKTRTVSRGVRIR